MQTFLPYKSFTSSARVLDNKRLGKQRVETLQIMKALVYKQGWVNHPATKMWDGYFWALLAYQGVITEEWIRRGFKDTCYDKTLEVYQFLPMSERNHTYPSWLGLKKFHSTHRGNLLRKDPVYYGQFGWTELPMQGYYWPTHTGTQKVKILRGN